MSEFFPIHDRMVNRAEKEARLQQRACVIWLYGLSGAGKSTLALGLEHQLFRDGFTTQLLDGDNIRPGLNRDLGFSDADRTENNRRVAEVCRFFLQAGVITICSIITSLRSQREQARRLIGPDDLLEVYVAASLKTCAQRDPKRLYQKSVQGGSAPLIGRDSIFEPPATDDPALIINTDQLDPATALARLHAAVLPRIRPAKP